MQVELKKMDGLKRELKVILPVEDVKTAYTKRLKEASKGLKLRGFRPGKVPLDVVEKRYGSSLKNEVAGTLMQSSFEEALIQENIQVVGMPNVSPGEFKKSGPFEYVASFEVYPEIALKDLSGVTLEKLVSTVTDADVDKMLAKIQQQQAEWVSAEREAQLGDRLLIDFVGIIDKKTFEGGTAKDFSLELGSQQMIPGFEEGLLGAKLNELMMINVTFPKDYHSEHLAGKEAVFEVTVEKIEELKLPDIDDALAEAVGIEGGLEALKGQVHEGMGRELNDTLETRNKTEILDKLIENNPIEIPQSLLEIEIDNLRNNSKKEIANRQGNEKDFDIDLPRNLFVDQARRRVTLGLLLNEIVKSNAIKADNALVRKRVNKIAAAYKVPEEVVSWYYNNKEMLSEVEALVIEDQVVAKLLDQVAIVEKPVSYDEVMNSDRDDEKEGEE